jgi:hypothetical protein
MVCRPANFNNSSWNVSLALNTSTASHGDLYVDIEHFLYSKVILVLCIIGILGNILNLIVLTRKSLSTRMDRMEKSAHMGLLALATSDLLFCLAAFPHCLQDREAFEHPTLGFWLIYEVYSGAVLNIFIMASTWLTVAMAVSRYLAICYPMKGRELLGTTASKCGIVIVFAFCIAFNLPRFWLLKVDYIEFGDGSVSYFARSGPLQASALGEMVYMWLYFTICILIPLLVLAYCNAYLIRALRLSASMRREHTRGRDSASDSKNIVTLTLSAIVCLYFVLVTPAELLNFTKYHVIADLSWLGLDRYNLGVALGNTLQAFNFAGNFVLYCVINVHFRRALVRLFRCRRADQKVRWSVKYESVTGTTRDTLKSTFPATSSRISLKHQGMNSV